MNDLAHRILMLFRGTMLLALIIVLLGFMDCRPTDRSESGATAVSPAATPTVETATFPPQTVAPNKEVFTQIDAVIVFQWDEDILRQEGGLIRIYDSSGEVWHTINYYDDSMEAMSEPGGKFRPYNFQSGNFRLQMRCTGKSANWYEVVVQEETNPLVRRYIQADNPLLKFRTWEQYLIGNNNLNFNPKSNPVLSSPNGERKRVEIESVLKNWTATAIQGDWIKIQWGPLTGDNRVRPQNILNSGWIRWRHNDTILVGEFYR